MPPKQTELLIVGAGPAGLEAALTAKKHGIDALLIDGALPGSVIERTTGSKYFHHAYAGNSAPYEGELLFPDGVLGSELVSLWRDQARALPHIFNTQVKQMVREGERFHVSTDIESISACAVILACGMFAQPKRLAVSGEALEAGILHEYDYETPPQGKRLLVIGSGNSAVEAALHASQENEVTLLVRGAELASSVTARNRVLLARASVRVAYATDIVSFEQGAALARNGSVFPYERAYVLIGYEKPSEWYRSFGVEIGNLGVPILSKNYETSLPGVFAVGALAGALSIAEGGRQAQLVISHIRERGILK